MDYDYTKLESVSPDVFQKAMADAKSLMVDATLADKSEINRMERLLDLKEGTLETMQFHLQKHNCVKCNRLLTFYDFVYTAIIDAGHPKSFIVHTLIGSKSILNGPRKIRCSSCNTVTFKGTYYIHDNYGCSYDP